jgi:hypothetical protein
MWKPYPKNVPEKSGYYLVLYEADNNGNYTGACVEKYYNKGDFINIMPSDINGTPEERLIDSLNNRTVYVEKPGFYTSGEDSNGLIIDWEVKPLYWTELPEPPNGAKYN